MAHLAAGTVGVADPQVVALIQGISDERVAVAAATARFAAAAAKSDALADDDNSAGAKRAREAARDEDARLQAASVRLENARETLAKFGSSKTIMPGGPTGTTALLDPGDELDQEEKASSRVVKRKLVAPKHGWLDAASKVHQRNFDRNLLLQNAMDIFWKLRKAVMEQAEAAPDEFNKAERAHVRRSNLLDPLEFSDKLKGMTICHALELGINLMNVAGAALYVHHKYNAAVADNFAGDEFFAYRATQLDTVPATLGNGDRQRAIELRLRDRRAVHDRNIASWAACGDITGGGRGSDITGRGTSRRGGACLCDDRNVSASR